MCETSKTPALSRTATCSSRMPAYWTGISQPANGTSRAPAATWRSYSGVRFKVSAPAAMRGRDPSTSIRELGAPSGSRSTQHLPDRWNISDELDNFTANPTAPKASGSASPDAPV